jgi:membrane protein YdbS with pleckstrin-like domain
MFCHNCGNETSRESRHCHYCGAVKIINLAEALSVGSDVSQERFPQNEPLSTLTATQEDCLFTIRPTFFKVGAFYAWAALMTTIATIVIANLGGRFIWVLGVGLVLFAIPLYQHLKWNNIRYILTNTKLEIEQGIFEKTSRYLSLWHIQNVTVNESLLERMLGIGDVLIDSASTTDKMVLKKIRYPRRYANQILARKPCIK